LGRSRTHANFVGEDKRVAMVEYALLKDLHGKRRWVGWGGGGRRSPGPGPEALGCRALHSDFWDRGANGRRS